MNKRCINIAACFSQKHDGSGINKFSLLFVCFGIVYGSVCGTINDSMYIVVFKEINYFDLLRDV